MQTENPLQNAYIGEYVERLPSAYQEVEYIQNSGTQHIETPFMLQDDYIYKCKLQYSALWWGNFGGYYGSTWNPRFYVGLRGDQSQWWWGMGNDYGSLWGLSTWVDYELEIELVNGSQYFKLNGNSLRTYSFSYSSSDRFPIRVFAETYNGGAWAWSANAKMYYFQLYNTSNQLVLNLVPCYRKSNNVIWMYDLVNNQFYTNAWTWTFTKWSDV